MSDLKKVVDLIIIEQPKSPEQLIIDMLQKVQFWQDNLKLLQEQYFESKFDYDSEDVREAMAMRKFLVQFLRHRIEWIRDQVSDPILKKKYLQFLPPFYQKGGIKVLLLHFFQVKESDDKKFLVFRGLNDQEKEIRILWDLYKLNKTIESIDVLYNRITSGGAFPSHFPSKKQIEILQNLKTVFRLMFQMCIQPKYQKELYRGITPQHISPEAILKRKEQEISYIFPHVLKKFNYRNHFFFIYFYSGMKAKIAGEVKSFHYNFLDFEILKQEFLIHWMQDTLAGNPAKTEIYKKYSFEGKTVFEWVSIAPEQEIEILQQLPSNVFNDLTAQVNAEVADDLKTEIEALSENFGGFSEFVQHFAVATTAAKASIAKLKEMVTGGKAKPMPKASARQPQASEKPELVNVPEPEPEEFETTYEVIKLKKNEIDFPYLTKTVGDFPKTLTLLRSKMGLEGYKNFAKELTRIFSSVSESTLIQRRTPKHEWILPYLIKEKTGPDETWHFCFLGAEVKAKQLGMGYQKSGTQSNYQFTPYFIYGCNKKLAPMGEPVDQRVIRGESVFEYSFQSPEVLEAFDKFFTMIQEK